MEEVWSVIRDSDGNKAPGPDGFNMKFFKEQWEAIKADMMVFFTDFHKNGVLVKGMNAAFVALIPKKDAPEVISDYRPISLIGSVYKILAKVLAKRLSGVVADPITDFQFAFTHGRQISDCILIASEVSDLL